MSLPEDKTSILKIIDVIKPDVISFEEFPEFFMDDLITKEIYKGSRTYKLYETTHDSSFPVYRKRFFPDKFHFVSAFNAFRYSMFDIPYEIIEYPVDNKVKNQKENQEKLGLDSSWRHVVNVGLFTPRKNQEYLFDIAKRLREYKIKFHFIGNQADNFRFYWEPLMKMGKKQILKYGHNGVLMWLKNTMVLRTSKNLNKWLKTTKKGLWLNSPTEIESKLKELNIYVFIK